MSTHQPSLGRGLWHINLLAHRAWAVIHIGVCYVLPLSIAVAVLLAHLGDDRRAGAWCFIASAAVLAVTTVLAARPPRQPRQRRPRSASVQRINRRAARILIPTALALATLMGVLALSACAPSATVACPTGAHLLPSDPASTCQSVR